MITGTSSQLYFQLRTSLQNLSNKRVKNKLQHCASNRLLFYHQGKSEGLCSAPSSHGTPWCPGLDTKKVSPGLSGETRNKNLLAYIVLTSLTMSQEQCVRLPDTER